MVTRVLCRALVALGLILAVVPVLAGPAVTGASAAAGTPNDIVFEGHGHGHGDGLSQWGALGYAVDFGWDWTQILSHYYGGTTRSTVDPVTPVSIRLAGHDDLTRHSFVHASGKIAVVATGATAAASTRWASIVVLETSAGVYRIWGRAALAACPTGVSATDYDTPSNGWTLIHAGIVATASNRIGISTPEVNTSTATESGLIGVCEVDSTITRYRGYLDLLDASDGGNRLVNVVGIDDYLRGVVPAEMIASWAGNGNGRGAQALRSQAVAARTYALTEHRYAYAQTCDNGNCQVYGGATAEDSRTDAAVTATAGVVLLNASGGLAFAQFSASSGGFTSGKNFPAVEDKGDATAGNLSHRWTVTVPTATIEAGFPTIGRFLGIEVTQRNGLGEWGGRVLSARIKGTSGTVNATGEQVRGALGLRSDWFNPLSSCATPTGTPLTAATDTFHATTPVRIVDTRSGLGGSRLPGDCRMIIPIRSLAQVPDTAVAVSVNITAVDAATGGYLTAFPCSAGRPLASNLNARAGAPVANLALLPVDVNGDICVYAQPATDLVVDLLGWFGPSGRGLQQLTPNRVVDTRNGGGPVIAGTELVVNLSGRVGGSVPVALNVTATESAAQGYVTVYPCGTTRPNASNLNLVPGRDIANHVSVGTDASARVCIYTQATTHLVVDLLGRFDGPLRFSAGTPKRLRDTRDSGAANAAGSVLRLAVGTRAVAAVNLTATGASDRGFATAYDCASARPLTSNLNFSPGVDVANVAIVGASGGELCIYTNVATHLVVDLLGTFV